MRPRIQTANLLDDGTGRVLLVVRRAADGWLALDLLGREEGCAAGPGWRLRVLRGGRAHPDRVFSLHALFADPAEVGALRVPDRVPAAFGFGGDLARIVRRAGRRAERRLMLFRGLTVIDPRAHLAPAGAALAEATAKLVFETPREELRERLRGRAAEEVSAGGA